MAFGNRQWRNRQDFRAKVALGGGGGRDSKLDRGRKVHGAQWCFVTGRDEMIDYGQMRQLQDTDAKWQAFKKNHPDWLLFKSKKEARRFLGLRVLLKVGAIRNLRRQVGIELKVRRPDGLDQVIGKYVADFIYEEQDQIAEGRPWVQIIEDTKGYLEDLYKWKKSHVETQLGVIIRES